MAQKFCTKCGTKLEEGAESCPNCGALIVRPVTKSKVNASINKVDNQVESSNDYEEAEDTNSFDCLEPVKKDKSQPILITAGIFTILFCLHGTIQSSIYAAGIEYSFGISIWAALFGFPAIGLLIAKIVNDEHNNRKLPKAFDVLTLVLFSVTLVFMYVYFSMMKSFISFIYLGLSIVSLALSLVTLIVSLRYNKKPEENNENEKG